MSHHPSPSSFTLPTHPPHSPSSLTRYPFTHHLFTHRSSTQHASTFNNHQQPSHHQQPPHYQQPPSSAAYQGVSEESSGHVEEALRSWNLLRPHGHPEGLPGGFCVALCRLVSPCVALCRLLCVAFVWPCVAFCGFYVASVWPLCGLYVASVWLLCGLCVASMWSLCGLCVASVWPLCGLCVASVWPLCGLCVVSVWPLCGLVYVSSLRGVVFVFLYSSVSSGFCSLRHHVPTGLAEGQV